MNYLKICYFSSVKSIIYFFSLNKFSGSVLDFRYTKLKPVFFIARSTFVPMDPSRGGRQTKLFMHGAVLWTPKFYLYGNGNKWGLLVEECKKNGKDDHEHAILPTAAEQLLTNQLK